MAKILGMGGDSITRGIDNHTFGRLSWLTGGVPAGVWKTLHRCIFLYLEFVCVTGNYSYNWRKYYGYRMG